MNSDNQQEVPVDDFGIKIETPNKIPFFRTASNGAYSFFSIVRYKQHIIDEGTIVYYIYFNNGDYTVIDEEKFKERFEPFINLI